MSDEEPAPVHQDPSGAVRLAMAWELFVLGIALISLANLFLFTLVRNDAVAQVVAVTEVSVTFVFVIDFLARLSVADDRRRYITRGYGWLDLMSCLPGLRVIRFLRVFTVVRRLRARADAEADIDDLFHNRARAILLFVLLLTVIVIEFG
ncbi:MAG TPA: ion transporter, partial [Candidatus Limnocylindrales bacterium]|nr:ion transporter [Candidatus Limnocylindrales bacterium]